MFVLSDSLCCLVFSADCCRRWSGRNLSSTFCLNVSHQFATLPLGCGATRGTTLEPSVVCWVSVSASTSASASSGFWSIPRTSLSSCSLLAATSASASSCSVSTSGVDAAALESVTSFLLWPASPMSLWACAFLSLRPLSFVFASSICCWSTSRPASVPTDPVMLSISDSTSLISSLRAVIALATSSWREGSGFLLAASNLLPTISLVAGSSSTLMFAALSSSGVILSMIDVKSSLLSFCPLISYLDLTFSWLITLAFGLSTMDILPSFNAPYVNVIGVLNDPAANSWNISSAVTSLPVAVPATPSPIAPPAPSPVATWAASFVLGKNPLPVLLICWAAKPPPSFMVA